jgi:hypothetical protein
MDHHTSIHQVGEGGVQAACSCGWRSPVFGADKATGTLDPLQHATEAADLHQWEMSLPWAAAHAGHDSARPSPANAGGRRRGRAPW